MVVSCMDVQGNVTMARAIKQYGLKMTQLWFSGNDQSTLNQNQSLMQGVYFDISHVPFTAPQSEYPGLKLYVDRDEEVRAQLRRRRDRHSGLGVGRAVRPGRQDGRQQPHPGQRDQGGQLLDRLHGRRARSRRSTGRVPATAAMRRPTASPTSRCRGTSTCRPSTRGRTSSTASSRSTRRRTRSSRCRPARRRPPDRGGR